MGARILVVDDDLGARRSLSMGLRTSGFRPAEAAGADEALQVLERAPVDLVITDMMMPGVHGLRFVRALQAKFPDLPIVLMSGYHVGRRQLERAGLRLLAFVPKPYDLAELVEFLRGKLPGARPRA